MVEQKEFKAQLSKKIHTEENSLDQRLDGLNIDFEHKWDNLQDSIEDIVDLQLCPPEEECQSDIMAEEQRVVTVQANQETETVESSLNKELDGFQNDFEQKLDILQESILKLAQKLDQIEENLEEECFTETILVEQAPLQPQEELKKELVKAPEDMQDAPVNFWPWTNEEQNTALLTEKSSEHETVEGTQEPIMDLDTTATAQDTKYSLLVAPSVDQVYILPSPTPQPTPATKSKPAAPAPKAKSNPLHAMQNIKRLVASVHTFATTSKKMENAYIAWHSGWFGCRFGFGALGPRHF